jgi:hypothetical protein
VEGDLGGAAEAEAGLNVEVVVAEGNAGGEGAVLVVDVMVLSPASPSFLPERSGSVATPGSAQVWYETMLAFLAEHVQGHDWQRPGLL